MKTNEAHPNALEVTQPTEGDYAAMRAIWGWLQQEHPPDYGDAFALAIPGIIARAHAAEREVASADRKLVDMIIGFGMEPMKPTRPGDPPCPEGYILIGRCFYDACRVAREGLT